jgi:hypothetical protein
LIRKTTSDPEYQKRLYKTKLQNSGTRCQRLTSGLAKLGGKVIVRISVFPLTVGDSPNCAQSSPNFVKPPGRYMQGGEFAEKTKFLIEKSNILSNFAA